MSFKKTAVIATAAGALCALAIPAFAETNIYAIARVGAFYDTQKAATTRASQTDFDLRNEATSRLGVITQVGNLGGKAELGLGGNNAAGAPTDTSQAGAAIGTGSASYVYTRELYGTYKFDVGTLLVGQTYQPYTVLDASVINDDAAGTDGSGGLYEGRQPQVKFTLNNGLYLDLIRPGYVAATVATTATSIASGTNNASTAGYLPKIAIGYDGKIGNLSLGGGVVGQVYHNTAEATQSAANELSYLGYVHAKGDFGALNALLNIGVGRNLAQMGFKEGTTSGLAANPDGTNVNVYTYSVLGQVGYTFSPMLQAYAGCGYINNGAAQAVAGKLVKHDELIQAFVNAPVTLAKGVSIVPEIAVRNQVLSATGAFQAIDYLYGAKFQIAF